MSACTTDAELTFFFFFNDTATTEIYTLSLHDALPISRPARDAHVVERLRHAGAVIIGKTNLSEWANFRSTHSSSGDRKSTRLNSSHANISYAVFCLKKKMTDGLTLYETLYDSGPVVNS